MARSSASATGEGEAARHGQSITIIWFAHCMHGIRRILALPRLASTHTVSYHVHTSNNVPFSIFGASTRGGRGIFSDETAHQFDAPNYFIVCRRRVFFVFTIHFAIPLLVSQFHNMDSRGKIDHPKYGDRSTFGRVPSSLMAHRARPFRSLSHR